MTAYELHFLQKSTILHFSEESIEKKFISMGIVPGSRIEIMRKAPLGGALYAKIDGLIIALRNSEAKSIVVE